jgi:hypothetical protein
VVQNKINVWKRVSNLQFLDAAFKKQKTHCVNIFMIMTYHAEYLKLTLKWKYIIDNVYFGSNIQFSASSFSLEVVILKNGQKGSL